MKESLDAFDVFAITKELKKLEDGYIEKVYQEGDEIFLKVKKDKKYDIFIKNGKWICITKHRREIEKPPDFAMVLRKYIGRGKIKKIEQYDFDRIIIFEIRKDRNYKLIVELIPNGNVILVDENGIIINSLLQQKWRHRIIKPHEKYLFPPSKKNIFEMEFEEFKDIFKEKDIVRALARAGIPGKWAEEICNIAKIDKKTPVEKLNDLQLKKIYNATKEIFNKFMEGKFNPVIVEKDVIPFLISKYEGKEMKKFSSVNEAFDNFYFENLEKEEKEKEEEERERIKRQIKKQEELIKKFIEDAERFKREGDAIFLNLEKVNEIIEKKKFDIGYPKAIIELPYENEKIYIEIDLRKNAVENAQEKYNASKKLKDKAKKAKKAMEESKEMIKKIKKVKKVKEKERKFWFENYRWFVSSDGNLVIGGKDARSNEKIVKKYLENDDIYVHADVHGAPSCIVKACDIDGNKIPIKEKTIEEACQFAIIYSKAWKQFGMASAYWVYPEQVSKTAQTGEFLPRGAFVIRGKRNYVKCKMEFAIGEVMIKKTKKIMGGPPSAIKKHSSVWMVFEPGDEDKNKVAKEIAKIFDVSIDKILRVLPPGGLKRKEEKYENH